jgi:AcrR family transcriptional regulator
MRNGLEADAAATPTRPRSGLNKKQLSRERSVEIILRSALTALVRKGYRNTTIEHIAEASGMTKGAIYHYYESKEDLLMAVLDMVERDVIIEEEPSSADARQAARALERADSYLFLVTLAGDLSNIGETVGNKVDFIMNRLGNTFERIVLTAQKAGHFSRRVTAGDLTRLWVSSFSGNVLVWHRSGRQDDIGRSLVRALRITCLSALTLDERALRRHR